MSLPILCSGRGGDEGLNVFFFEEKMIPFQNELSRSVNNLGDASGFGDAHTEIKIIFIL